MTNALAAPWMPPQWDDARVALIKKIICPPTAKAEDFEYFVAWCRRSGLDPMMKQAFLVERKAKDANGNWNVRHEPMAAEAGMAAVADAQADYLGMKAAVVYAGDVFAIDEAAQTIEHKWSVEAREKAGNRVIGAWAHARRQGRDTPLVFIRTEQRIQTRYDNGKQVPTSFWLKDTPGMIVKCARAMAYRLCYPNLFSGVPIREELGDDDSTPPAPLPPSSPSTSGVDRLAARLGVAPKPLVASSPATLTTSSVVATEPEPVPVHHFEPPPVPDAAPDTSPSSETTVPVAEAAAAKVLTRIEFGPHKGTFITDATLVQLQESIALGEHRLEEANSKTPPPKWVKPTQANIDAMEEEVGARAVRDLSSAPQGDEPF